MITDRPARTLATAVPMTWPRTDLRRLGLRATVAVLCLTSALLLTASRLEITRLRYELSTLDRQRQSLLADAARLQVEAAALSAPRRVEAVAAQLGYVYPDRGSVVVLDE
ncbi:MAG: cell division protein FtsL [Deltaproteobacteria bacterium]|nr:cell division protein FtsL [Deltaproteobacteria bacterium]